MADYIQIGDRVKFIQNKNERNMEHGVVESIIGDCMTIRIDDHKGKRSWGALKINEKWYAFCQYTHEYTEEILKE
jgi:hypothetical protein